MRDGKAMMDAFVSTGACRISCFAVAISHFARFLTLYLFFLRLEDVDSFADLLCDRFPYVVADPLMLVLIIVLFCGLVKDCYVRYRVGCWTESKWGVHKRWVAETVYLAIVASVTLLLLGLFEKETKKETLEGVTWRYSISDGNAIAGRDCRHNRRNRPAITVSVLGHLTIPPLLGGHPVKGIGEFAFHKCKRLTSVTIPVGVEEIGRSAFRDCEGLTSVVLPDSVKHIGYCAFSGCSNLVSVSIPPNVASINDTAFTGTPFLDNMPEGLIVLSGIAYRWKGACPEEVLIPDGVTRIFDNAFERRAGFKSVVVASSVTNVGYAAFHGCTGLTSVALGNRVASIENGAFYACFKLSSVSIPRSLTSVGQDAFRGCPIKTIYVEKGDADRVRELLRGKGVDVDKVEFVEREAAPQAQAAPDSANGVAK